MVLYIMSGNIRTDAFAEAGRSGAPIISALSQYHAGNGEYPEKLSALVPDYLPEIPWTGLIGYPEFYYFKANREYKNVKDYPADYELGIHCGVALINFDTFFYWPSEKYPDRGRGGSIERIDNWAYVHE